MFSRLRMKKKVKTVNEMLMGKNLDDNRWHSIRILRVTRLLDIKLDGNKERTILIPGLTTDFHLNRVIFVGGIRKDVALKDDSARGVPFRGCLKNVMVDNKQPLVELRRRNKNLAIYGIVSRPCHSNDFNPVQFPNPQSVVDVVRIPPSTEEREMEIKLQFRTFDSEGTFLYAEGKRCHFVLGIQKKQARFNHTSFIH